MRNTIASNSNSAIDSNNAIAITIASTIINAITNASNSAITIVSDSINNSTSINIAKGVFRVGKTITFSIQKGGSGKTTTVGIVGYLLSQKYKVLLADMDSQGNLTEMVTQRDIYDFEDQTIFEALQDQDARPYVHHIKENLDILTAEDNLAAFSRYIYTAYAKKDLHGHVVLDEYGNIQVSRDSSRVLRKTIDTVKDDYDFILIDTPPSLSDHTVNALTASDGLVVVFETSQFSYSAVGRFLQTAEMAQQRTNPDLKLTGILPTMIDSRRVDSKAFIELIREEHKDLVFKTVIRRKAAVARLPVQGFVDNKELNQALNQYQSFVKELLERV